MHVAFLNPQGNFDPNDSYWTEHPDFGGQLVYVKQVALAMAELGHQVDIMTRQVVDPEWPEFAEPFDAYAGAPNVRIVRLPAGPKGFLRKELLWPHLVQDWVPNVLAFYRGEGGLPDAMTTHYGDGGLGGALIEAETGVPFTFTAHSLGAQKMDKLHVTRANLAHMDERYHFARRIVAERLSMNRSAVNVTSTRQERYSQYSHNAYRGAVDWTDDARFAVVPPGVNMDIFDRASRHQAEEAVHVRIRAALARDLPPERTGLPCVVASSRLDPKKNHLGLVEAFACSPELRQRANLVIVTGNIEDPLRDYRGAGETERTVLDGLMETIARDKLRGQISMFALHSQGELAAAYRFFVRRHSVFALTAHYEPFGLAPLEAMAAGLPAVVTKFGGPSESLREGDEEYGILVDPDDPEEVSAVLYSLIIKRDRWRHYAEVGYGRVQARYTWQRTAEGYVSLIEQAVADPAARRPDRLLSFHPYFRDPNRENDIALDVLDDLYLKLDVLAVGEAVVDFISHERVNSLRTARQFTRYLGGQPANVAVYVAKLGARSALLARVGADRFGEFLGEQLQRHGVNTEVLRHTDEMPTSTVFLTQTTGVPDFQVNRGAEVLLDIHDVSEELIARAQVVHSSCFALSREPARSAVRRALRLAHRHGKLVSLDPNYSPSVWPDKEEAWEVIAQILPYVTVVKPSLTDARRLFDPNMEEDELQAACLHEFHDLGAEVVIFTRSGGVVVVSDGETVEPVGPLSLVEVKSVTGGSDAFWGALLVARLDGNPWPLCVRFAHQVAARKLQKVGHVEHMIDRQEIYRRLEE
ncbi:MAG: PfkB family carbohydrate kinase [Anaerolineae bacterium]